MGIYAIYLKDKDDKEWWTLAEAARKRFVNAHAKMLAKALGHTIDRIAKVEVTKLRGS